MKMPRLATQVTLASLLGGGAGLAGYFVTGEPSTALVGFTCLGIPSLIGSRMDHERDPSKRGRMTPPVGCSHENQGVKACTCEQDISFRRDRYKWDEVAQWWLPRAGAEADCDDGSSADLEALRDAFVAGLPHSALETYTAGVVQGKRLRDLIAADFKLFTGDALEGYRASLETLSSYFPKPPKEYAVRPNQCTGGHIYKHGDPDCQACGLRYECWGGHDWTSPCNLSRGNVTCARCGVKRDEEPLHPIDVVAPRKSLACQEGAHIWVTSDESAKHTCATCGHVRHGGPFVNSHGSTFYSEDGSTYSFSAENIQSIQSVSSRTHAMRVRVRSGRTYERLYSTRRLAALAAEEGKLDVLKSANDMNAVELERMKDMVESLKATYAELRS